MSQEDKCTETLEGDKIGCIYSVMIKPLADLLFIFQLMLTHFCWIIEYGMGPGPLGTMCINHYFWHDMATLIFGEDAFSVLDILDSVSITVGG